MKLVKIDPAALWSIGQQVGGQGINYLAFAVLAVLLEPEDFGLAGVAMVWINFGLVFAELGFGAAIIQRETIDDAHLSTTFVMNLTIGAVLTVAGLAAAGPLASAFHVPAAEPVVRALSLTFLFRSVGLTHAVIAQRRLDFRSLAGRDAIAAGAGALVGVSLAYGGFGVYALVWQSLVASLVGALLLLRVVAWRPELRHCSIRALGDLWSYSSQMFLFGVFKFLAQNADKSLVVYLLGPGALGLYTLASRLVLVPTSLFAGAVGSYLFPRLAALQSNREAARATFAEALSFVARVLLPFVAVAAVLGPSLVLLVFGDDWAPASVLLPMMAVVAAATAVISPGGQVMKAMGRPNWLLWWSIGFTALIAASLAVGQAGRLPGMAFALAVAHLLGLLVIQTVLRLLLGFSATDLAAAVGPPLLASVAGATLGLLALRLPAVDGWTGLAAGLVAFGVGYALTLATLTRWSSRPKRAS